VTCSTMKHIALSILVQIIISTVAQNGWPAVKQTAQLLHDMKHQAEADGRKEQQAYDELACWCEDTLSHKADDIEKGKKLIKDLKTDIDAHKADMSILGDGSKELGKLIATNAKSTQQMIDIRTKEKNNYLLKRTDIESCLATLEQVILTLTGAGTRKKGFLESFQEAQMLSMVASMRSVLKKPDVAESISDADMATIRKFLEQPEQSLGTQATSMSAAQVSQASQVSRNPFGNYGAQSGSIQGILKHLHDHYTQELERENGKESDNQKAFEELLATKQKEKGTLQTTKDKKKLGESQTFQMLAEGKQALDKLEDLLKKDLAVFDQVKEDCQKKAAAWSERSRARTNELKHLEEAIGLLSSPDAQRTYHNSSVTLVQVGAVADKTAPSHRRAAYSKLKGLATSYHSLKLAEIAAMTMNTGNFDSVIASINALIQTIRSEQQDDVQHRDRCQIGTGTAQDRIDGLRRDTDKSKKAGSRLQSKAWALKKKIVALDVDIEASKKERFQALSIRTKEHTGFIKSVKHDTAAAKILQASIKKLSDFYKKKGIPIRLIQFQNQTVSGKPVYNTKNHAPQTNYGHMYAGRNVHVNAIIAKLILIKENIEQEINRDRKDDMESQAAYEKQTQKTSEMLEAQIAAKLDTQQLLADLQEKISDEEEYQAFKKRDLSAQEKLQLSITKDCLRVVDEFAIRSAKRQKEIDGLQEAKDYLAGIDSGEELAP